MSNEHHLYGPPGAGKTTWVRRQALKAVNEASYSPRDLLFCSFTRAAARELVSRDLPIASDQQVGTLHALSYRALDRPRIAESYIDKSDQEHITPWNEYASRNLRLSQGKVDVDEMGNDIVTSSDADVAFADMQRYRARMNPLERWNRRAREIHEHWSRWCEVSGLVDFTGLIELAIQNTQEAPGSPKVGFFDEAQDFSPIELELARKWGSEMDYFILAGDPQQCIYHFRGATPNAFLGRSLPEENKHRLRKAWRMKQAVHDNAARWIERASEKEVFDFEHAGEGGTVASFPATSRFPEKVIEFLPELTNAGKSVMILGATSFIIDATKHALRDAGLPFHNPYRRRRGDWNPLHSSGVSSAERIAAFLSPAEYPAGRLWTAEQIKIWTGLITTSGILIRGKGKKYLESLPDDEPVTFFHMQQIFEEAALDRLLYEWGTVRDDLSSEFLAGRLLSSKKAGAEFPFEILRKHGVDTLTEEPKVTIGTIHSVKGGEADVVILYPDLSPAGHREYTNQPLGTDAVLRQFYVALSRAREAVYVCTPSSGLSVRNLL